MKALTIEQLQAVGAASGEDSIDIISRAGYSGAVSGAIITGAAGYSIDPVLGILGAIAGGHFGSQIGLTCGLFLGVTDSVLDVTQHVVEVYQAQQIQEKA